MTNGWIDIKNTDMMLIMGENPAENHPCGFKWAMDQEGEGAASAIQPQEQLLASIFLQPYASILRISA